MHVFTPGQRWISETEPELGLGLVLEVTSKTLTILFAKAQEQRTYGKQNPPLKRVEFAVGDTIRLMDERQVVVEARDERAGLILYYARGEELQETLLSPELQFSKPEERFLNGLIDPQELFHLRIRTLSHRADLHRSPLRGLMGGKISLIPHQLYIASRVCEMRVPRVLLADQVGLGKTIEAALIIHRLLLKNQVQRVMILLPDSLVHQWFFELYRRFSLSFKMINQETPLEKGENPFEANERVIVAMGLLKGSSIARDLLAKAEFDLLVVDEAHALKTQEAEQSFEFEMVESLGRRIPRLILLTATPEQFGQEDHFRRLKILDPYKYDNFESYQEGKKSYQKVVSLIQELDSHDQELSLSRTGLGRESFSDQEYESLSVGQAQQALIDRYGTGRSYFRNIRKSMDRELLFFPRRHVHAEGLDLPAKTKMTDPLKDHEVDAVFELKCEWLLSLLQEKLSEQKILLICKSKKKILKVEEFLKRHLAHFKTAAFHSDLSLMARDRQAAYFADPEGAQILLCTEVGSEGRNFEFCQNLILFDLPLHPLPLEQRIGRLDRIGQKRDIHLFIPYIQRTWEESLFRWYHQGLNVFEEARESSQEVYERVRSSLQKNLVSYQQEELERLLTKTQELVKEVEEELQSGRDLLVEKNSFEPAKARELVKAITKHDTSDELAEYLEQVFECFGVDSEEIQASTWFVRPSDNMFVPAFPHLDQSGKTFTFSRTKALEREDFDFLTWDHPLVLGALDLIISQNFGTNCVVQRLGGKGGAAYYFEAYYVLDCPAPRHLNLERFGVGEVIRFIIDEKGRDLSEKWTKEIVDQKVGPAESEVIKAMRGFPKERFMATKKQVDHLAQAEANTRVQQTLSRAEAWYQQEIHRLEELSRYQPSLAERELSELKQLSVETTKALQGASLRFDAFRFIL